MTKNDFWPCFWYLRCISTYNPGDDKTSFAKRNFNDSSHLTRWFQAFFVFTLTWGNDPIWLIFVNWVETTNYGLRFQNLHSSSPSTTSLHPEVQNSNLRAQKSGEKRGTAHLSRSKNKPRISQQKSRRVRRQQKLPTVMLLEDVQRSIFRYYWIIM